MKKLFILFLCLMAVAGFVSAGAAHPPGEHSPVLSGYAVDYYAVTPDTVLITDALALPDQVWVVPDIMLSGLPQVVFMITVDDVILPGVIVETVDYPTALNAAIARMR
jgi:hypothetical protein